MVAGGPGGHSVTRAIFETLNFFCENVEKIMKKNQNCVKYENFMQLNIIY